MTIDEIRLLPDGSTRAFRSDGATLDIPEGEDIDAALLAWCPPEPPPPPVVSQSLSLSEFQLGVIAMGFSIDDWPFGQITVELWNTWKT